MYVYLTTRFGTGHFCSFHLRSTRRGVAPEFIHMEQSLQESVSNMYVPEIVHDVNTYSFSLSQPGVVGVLSADSNGLCLNGIPHIPPQHTLVLIYCAHALWITIVLKRGVSPFALVVASTLQIEFKLSFVSNLKR